MRKVVERCQQADQNSCRQYPGFLAAMCGGMDSNVIIASQVEPLLPILDDAQALVELVSTITSSSVADVTQRLLREHERLGSNVNAEFSRLGQQRGVWNAGLIEFYSTTDSFLYESIVWNRTAEKCRMRRWIADWVAEHHDGPAHVLVYGDGLGFDSLYLSKASHQVDYFEVSDSCAKFAEHIFAEEDASPTILRSPEHVLRSHYDVAVCLDVLEHVPEPCEIVRSLTSALRPGGHLIVHAPFWYVGRKVPTHLRSNRRYSGDFQQLYKPFELELVDGCFFWNPVVLRKIDRDVSEVAKSPRIGLRLGGYLLSIARYCSTPHTFLCELLLGTSKTRWQDLHQWAKQCSPHETDLG